MLSGAYPNWDVAHETIVVWARFLQDIDLEIANEAAAIWIGDNKFPPTIADLRASARIVSARRAPTTPTLPPADSLGVDGSLARLREVRHGLKERRSTSGAD